MRCFQVLPVNTILLFRGDTTVFTRTLGVIIPVVCIFGRCVWHTQEVSGGDGFWRLFFEVLSVVIRWSHRSRGSSF
jgi:hypothetical protein